MGLPIDKPQIISNIDYLRDKPIDFPAPFGIDLYDDEWSDTPLGEIAPLGWSDEEFSGKFNNLMGDVKASYDVDPSGGFSGVLQWDGVVIWECNHHHSKPEYNRRSVRGGDSPWAASAAYCGQVAYSEFRNLIERSDERGNNHIVRAHVKGFPGLYAHNENLVSVRQDAFTLVIVSGMESTSYRLRIWNAPDARVLYVNQQLEDDKMLVGYINLEDPNDTTGRPDPSLFRTPADYRRWLRAAAWAYEHTWGDSFRSQLFEEHYSSATLDVNDINPTVPKRAAQFFKPARKPLDTESEVDKAPKVSIKRDSSRDITHAGWWMRTNRDGRKRSFTVMYGNDEVETFINRGEATEFLARQTQGESA